MLSDPRPARISRELSKRLTIVILGVKGGVGKTTIALLLGIGLARRGRRTLLIDLDITDPNLHVGLGIDPRNIMPGEKKGIDPIRVDGLGFVSIAPYAKGLPLALRGVEAVNALRELLSAIDYEGYDTVVIDTPPGAGDIVLDLLNVLENPRLVVVSSTSKFSLDSLHRLLWLLKEMGKEPDAIVYNMVRDVSNNFLREGILVRYDDELESAFGNLELLEKTNAYKDLENLIERILEKDH
ncbi:MAG: P-loop NTPase [Desulfurococcales archaeon]|nr:P-loop NTPase [Desulfurococcales archaeon]